MLSLRAASVVRAIKPYASPPAEPAHPSVLSELR